MENPLLTLVKAKDSSCAPAASTLSGIHQTDSKEKHYSMSKEEVGICGHNMHIGLRRL